MTDVKLIPLGVLLGHPERTAAQISPDGKRLSDVAPLEGVLNVFVGEAGTEIERPVTHDTARGIQGYFWAHDNRHIMYLRDKGGSENFRLYDVDLETGVERDLAPLPVSAEASWRRNGQQYYVVHRNAEYLINFLGDPDEYASDHADFDAIMHSWKWVHLGGRV